MHALTQIQQILFKSLQILFFQIILTPQSKLMESQQDILVNLDFQLVQASSGKRFANYIIDLIVFYALFFVAGIVIALLSPESIDDVEAVGNNQLLDRLISLLLFGVYMGVLEAIFKGRTLGKLITGTRAVNEDGSTISFQKGFLRGLCRIVPFEPFSALGSPAYPWHDKWTNTYVIDIRESRLEQ